VVRNSQDTIASDAAEQATTASCQPWRRLIRASAHASGKITTRYLGSPASGRCEKESVKPNRMQPQVYAA